MTISTKGRYGLRALADLALSSRDGNPVTVASIAERQNISEGYLEQIISTLRKANIVTGIKGPQGGYIPARPAHEIKIKQVLETLEGDLFTVKEENTGKPKADALEYAIRQSVWKPMADALTAANEALTLQDILDAFSKINGTEAMYFI